MTDDRLKAIKQTLIDQQNDKAEQEARRAQLLAANAERLRLAEAKWRTELEHELRTIISKINTELAEQNYLLSATYVDVPPPAMIHTRQVIITASTARFGKLTFSVCEDGNLSYEMVGRTGQAKKTDKKAMPEVTADDLTDVVYGFVEATLS